MTDDIRYDKRIGVWDTTLRMMRILGLLIIVGNFFLYMCLIVKDFSMVGFGAWTAVIVVNSIYLYLHEKKRGRTFIAISSLLFALLSLFGCVSLLIYTSSSVKFIGVAASMYGYVSAVIALLFAIFFTFSFILFSFSKYVISLYPSRERRLASKKQPVANQPKPARNANFLLGSLAILGIGIGVFSIAKDYLPVVHEDGVWRRYYLMPDVTTVLWGKAIEYTESYSTTASFRGLTKSYRSFEECREHYFDKFHYDGLDRVISGYEHDDWTSSYYGGCARDCDFGETYNNAARIDLHTCKEVVELYK